MNVYDTIAPVVSAALVEAVRETPRLLDLIRHGMDHSPDASLVEELSQLLPEESRAEMAARRIEATRAARMAAQFGPPSDDPDDDVDGVT